MHIHQTSTQFPYLYFAIFVYTVMYCEFCWFFTFCIINPIPSCRIQEIWSYSENHVIPSALCSTTNDQTSMISFSNLLHNMINMCVFHFVYKLTNSLSYSLPRGNPRVLLQDANLDMSRNSATAFFACSCGWEVCTAFTHGFMGDMVLVSNGTSLILCNLSWKFQPMT